MQVKLYEDYDSLSAHVAEELIMQVRQRPAAVICMASGDSPRLTCQIVAQRSSQEKIDFSHSTFIGLDEWMGIPPEDEGSCHFFFKSLLLDPLHFHPSQVHLFDALATDVQRECWQMDQAIAEKGGIDLMIVGIGINGHIGFNEPGSSFENYSHVAALDEITTSVGQKYFKGPVKLNRGITLGLKHLMESRKLILMANGSKKSGVIKKAIEGKITNEFPASIVQQHPNCLVMIDREAASQLDSTAEINFHNEAR